LVVRSLPAPLRPLTARLDALQLGTEEIAEITAHLPTAPATSVPSRDRQVALNLAYYNLGTLRVAAETISAIQTLWTADLLTGVPLQARLLFELWGAACFTEKLANRLGDHELEENTFELSERLIGGSPFPVPRPWAGDSSLLPVHVMDLVRSIEPVRKEAPEDYDFLSDASHPNYLQQMSFWMAGSAADNWRDRRFADYALGMLTRLVDLTETSLAGIKRASRSLQRTLAPVLKETPPKRR
jgi:hypothetical protein